MNKVIEILMKRDGMTEDEAKRVLTDTQFKVQDAIFNNDFDDVEDIIADNLGLEMDYAMDILF